MTDRVIRYADRVTVFTAKGRSHEVRYPLKVVIGPPPTYVRWLVGKRLRKVWALLPGGSPREFGVPELFVRDEEG